MLPLSPKEKRFLTLYYQGKSYKEICVELDISLSTAKTHANNILAKTIGAACLRNAAYRRRYDLEDFDSDNATKEIRKAPDNQARISIRALGIAAARLTPKLQSV